MQGFASLEEVNDGGIEINSAAHANAIGKCVGRSPDGGDAERFVLRAVELGDKSSRRGKILEDDIDTLYQDYSNILKKSFCTKDNNIQSFKEIKKDGVSSLIRYN